MATITKRVDRRVESHKRYQYWASSENADDGTAIALGDIFMIEDSLGKPARYVYIETAADTDLSVKFNTQIRTYPLRAEVVNQPQRPDLENEVIATDSSMAAIPIDANETWILDGVLPVSDITISAWTAGSFEIYVV